MISKYLKLLLTFQMVLAPVTNLYADNRNNEATQTEDWGHEERYGSNLDTDELGVMSTPVPDKVPEVTAQKVLTLNDKLDSFIVKYNSYYRDNKYDSNAMKLLFDQDSVDAIETKQASIMSRTQEVKSVSALQKVLNSLEESPLYDDAKDFVNFCFKNMGVQATESVQILLYTRMLKSFVAEEKGPHEVRALYFLSAVFSNLKLNDKYREKIDGDHNFALNTVKQGMSSAIITILVWPLIKPIANKLAIFNKTYNFANKTFSKWYKYIVEKLVPVSSSRALVVAKSTPLALGNAGYFKQVKEGYVDFIKLLFGKAGTAEERAKLLTFFLGASGIIGGSRTALVSNNIGPWNDYHILHEEEMDRTIRGAMVLKFVCKVSEFNKEMESRNYLEAQPDARDNDMRSLNALIEEYLSLKPIAKLFTQLRSIPKDSKFDNGEVHLSIEPATGKVFFSRKFEHDNAPIKDSWDCPKFADQDPNFYKATTIPVALNNTLNDELKSGVNTMSANRFIYSLKYQIKNLTQDERSKLGTPSPGQLKFAKSEDFNFSKSDVKDLFEKWQINLNPMVDSLLKLNTETHNTAVRLIIQDANAGQKQLDIFLKILDDKMTENTLKLDPLKISPKNYFLNGVWQVPTQ